LSERGIVTDKIMKTPQHKYIYYIYDELIIIF